MITCLWCERSTTGNCIYHNSHCAIQPCAPLTQSLGRLSLVLCLWDGKMSISFWAQCNSGLQMVAAFTSGLTDQVEWLGLRVGGHPALYLHSLNELGKLLHGYSHNDSIINIIMLLNKRNLTIKTSAAILATAKLPECIHFMQTAKSRGKCCMQSCWLNLQNYAHCYVSCTFMWQKYFQPSVLLAKARLSVGSHIQKWNLATEDRALI